MQNRSKIYFLNMFCSTHIDFRKLNAILQKKISIRIILYRKANSFSVIFIWNSKSFGVKIKSCVAGKRDFFVKAEKNVFNRYLQKCNQREIVKWKVILPTNIKTIALIKIYTWFLKISKNKLVSVLLVLFLI